MKVSAKHKGVFELCWVIWSFMGFHKVEIQFRGKIILNSVVGNVGFFAFELKLIWSKKILLNVVGNVELKYAEMLNLFNSKIIFYHNF